MHIESIGNYSPRSNCNLIGVKCGFENKTQFPLQWEVIFEIQPTSTQLYFSKVHATFPPDGWTVFTSPFGGTYITKYMGLIDANTYLEFDIEPLMPLRYLIPEGPFPRVQVVTWDAAGNPFFTTPWEVPGSTMPGTTGIPFEGGTPSNPLAVSSLFFLPSASASCGLEYPWNIGISGVVAVDDDFCFLSPVNADPRPAWKMGKRTKIVVTAPNTLTLRGIDIESCGHCGIGLTCPEMWESIVVMPGATLICENVKFRDGIRAIDVKPGGKVALKNCTFRNNYIGVHLQGSAEVLALDDNTFIGGSLNEALEFPVGIEQEPDFPAQDKAFCGIYGLEATNLLLTPSNPGMRNTFKNIANGIVLERSNATIKNAFFENIQPLAAVHPFSGRGISSRSDGGNFPEIMGQGASGPVNFDNVDVGIYTQRLYQLMHGNRMAGDSTHLTPLQQQTLEAVAATCPLDGGDPVFMARAMLAPLGLAQYDDFDACIEAEPRSAPGSQGVIPGALSLSPNPSQGHVILTWTNPDIARIILFDIHGRQMHDQDVAAESYRTLLLIGQLPAGIYQCVATDVAGKQVAVSRLVNNR